MSHQPCCRRKTCSRYFTLSHHELSDQPQVQRRMSTTSEASPLPAEDDLQLTRLNSSVSGRGLPPIGSRTSSAGPVSETTSRSQSYQEKVAARANSGVANALAAAAAGGKHMIQALSRTCMYQQSCRSHDAGGDRDMQAALPSGRHLGNDAELSCDAADRLPGQSQRQLEVRQSHNQNRQ